jgi:3-methyladenine DNA glycosylase/8-oxoguanine DNA glycosylase
VLDVTTVSSPVQGSKPEGNVLTSSAFDKTMAKVRSAELALRGAGGEPVDFRRTIASHGVADLPPNRIDEEAWTLELTLPLEGKAPRTVLVSGGRKGFAKLEVPGRAPGKADLERLRSSVAHVLRLDEDLRPFYEAAAADPDLAWATAGAGRMIRSPTVFEEVVKTICTTNCAWSATVRMVSALVEHLGEPGDAADGPFGRAFPTPEAMARADLRFYKDVVRAGYRGPYLQSLAESVASGELDLESLSRASTEELPDDELAAELLALPGVGPYAAAHIMMLIGRYTPLILDSWTRPKYLKVSGGKRAKDTTIERRFRRYGSYAGLAFWLYLTRDWVEPGP